MFDRIFKNLKTTIAGSTLGATASAAVFAILEQAGCDFSAVQWGVILGIVFAGPAVQGGLSTDTKPVEVKP